MEGAPFVSTSTSSSPSSYSLLSEVARVLDAGPHTGPLLVQQLRKRHLSVEDVLAAADAAEVGADEAGDKRRRQSGGRMMVRPWSYEDFLQRLQTFKAALWFAKPPAVSALECARLGWCNSGRDALACACCEARLVHDTAVDPAGTKLRDQLVHQHERFCGWIDNASPEAFLVFPDEPASVVRDKYLQRVRSLIQALEQCNLDAEKLLALFDISAFKSSLEKVSASSQSGEWVELIQKIVDNISQFGHVNLNIPLRKVWRQIKEGRAASALFPLSASLFASGDSARGASDQEGQQSSSEAEEVPSHLLFIVILVALFGWESQANHSAIRCGICGGSVELAGQQVARPCNVVRDHRFYCPWVNSISSSGGLGEVTTVGWIRCAAAVLSETHASQAASTGTGATTTSAVVSPHMSEAGHDPVASFNRINSIISMMCSPPVPQAPLSL